MLDKLIDQLVIVKYNFQDLEMLWQGRLHTMTNSPRHYGVTVFGEQREVARIVFTKEMVKVEGNTIILDLKVWRLGTYGE